MRRRLREAAATAWVVVLAVVGSARGQVWTGGIKPAPGSGESQPSFVDLVKESAYRSWVMANAHRGAKDKVFFLGPAKPSPNVLPYFEARGYGVCRTSCLGSQWHRAVKKRERRSTIWTMYDVFVEPGGVVDYEWLDRHFPKGRFVLKTSRLRSFVTLRYTLRGKSRVSAGCTYTTPEGGDMCSRRSPSLDNSLTAVRSWITKVAEAQDAAIVYFNASSARRQRFAALELPGTPETNVRRLLDWVTRSSPQVTRRSADVVLSPHMVPTLRHNRTARPSPPALSLGHGGRPPPSDQVDAVLIRIGCGPRYWNDLWYSRCSRVIERRA